MQKEDIGEKEPVHEIEFLPDEWNREYDIKNEEEHFRLLLDRKKITRQKYLELDKMYGLIYNLKSKTNE